MVNRRRFARKFEEARPAVSELDPIQRSELESLVAAIVEGQGLWCEEVVVGGQPGDRILSVVIDRIDELEGVTLDTISLITQEVSAALDAQGDAITELGHSPTPWKSRPLVLIGPWCASIIGKRIWDESSMSKSMTPSLQMPKSMTLMPKALNCQ